MIYDSIMAEYEEAYRMRVDRNGPRDLTWTPGYKMPWPRLTKMLNGLRAGMHVVAARPSVGKTAYAVNLIRFWCDNGIKVVFNSLDMPRKEAMRRFLTERSRVSLRKACFSPTETDLKALADAREEISKWPLTFVEIRDVDEFKSFCMIEKAAGRLQIVVIDYLQLMHSRRLGREDAVEYARISYVSDAVKSLANELEVPVIALCQLNRESTKSDRAGSMPGLADLRGSGSIEQDAFTVTILHRDQRVVDGWASTPPRRLIPGGLDPRAQIYGADDLDAVWWILCKAQNGGTGMFPFVPRKNTSPGIWATATHAPPKAQPAMAPRSAQRWTIRRSSRACMPIGGTIRWRLFSSSRARSLRTATNTRPPPKRRLSRRSTCRRRKRQSTAFLRIPSTSTIQNCEGRKMRLKKDSNYQTREMLLDRIARQRETILELNEQVRELKSSVSAMKYDAIVRDNQQLRTAVEQLRKVFNAEHDLRMEISRNVHSIMLAANDVLRDLTAVHEKMSGRV